MNLNKFRKQSFPSFLISRIFERGLKEFKNQNDNYYEKYYDISFLILSKY